MPLSSAQLEVTRTGSGVRIAYAGVPLVVETGAGIPLGGRWWWSFDGSLRLVDAAEHDGSDQLGAYAALALTYGTPAIAYLESRSEIPDLPAAIPDTSSFEEVQRVVRAALSRVER